MVQRELDVAASSSSAVADADASGAGAGLEAPLNIAPKKVDWDLKRDVEKAYVHFLPHERFALARSWSELGLQQG